MSRLATLRRIAKRAILCLLLGAALQYLVAVGFSMDGSAGTLIQAWTLAGTLHDQYSVTLIIGGNRSLGREVLRADYLPVGDRYGVLPDLTKIDFSEYDWRVNIDLTGFYGPDVDSSPEPRPPSWSRFAAIRTAPTGDYYPPDKLTECIEVGCGWPRRSASYFAVLPSGCVEYTLREGIAIGTLAPEWGDTPRVIPLMIHWPGAIANTLLYAAALFVPFTLIPITRRHLRRRAGRCIACGYDLRGAAHPVCPECGSMRRSGPLL